MEISEQDWKVFDENYELTREQIFQIFPYRANYEELKQLLLDSKTDSIYNNRFTGIRSRFPISMSDNEYMKLLQFFLLENWHHDHESIIGAFQDYFHNDKENIEYLMQALNTLPEFYQNGDIFKYPYVRKIIYAIGAQPEPYNIEALEKIAQYEDEKIRELALHQIEKRKRLGRWEAESNK